MEVAWSLQSLWLSFNDLETLPVCIEELTGLKTLHVNHNRITRLPPTVGLCLLELTVLFYHTNITQLPYYFYSTASPACRQLLGCVSSSSHTTFFTTHATYTHHYFTRHTRTWTFPTTYLHYVLTLRSVPHTLLARTSFFAYFTTHTRTWTFPTTRWCASRSSLLT